MANHLSNTGNLEVSQQGLATTEDGSDNPGANSPEATAEQADNPGGNSPEATAEQASTEQPVHSPSASKATGSPSKSAQWKMNNASLKKQNIDSSNILSGSRRKSSSKKDNTNAAPISTSRGTNLRTVMEGEDNGEEEEDKGKKKRTSPGKKKK